MNTIASLPYIDEIKKLCSPLRALFDVTHFAYLRFYKNGSIYCLTDRPEWGDIWFIQKHYQHDFVKNYVQLKFGNFFLWNQFGEVESIEAGKKFDIANGITFANSLDNFVEMFWFGTTTHNKNHCALYEKNRDSFLRFIEFFKDAGSDLIKKSLENPPFFTENALLFESKIKSVEENISTLKNPSSLRFSYITEGKRNFLSRQETICASYYIIQNSIREIAKKINLSERTVEDYINNIKVKLNCFSKNELLNKLLSLEIINIDQDPLIITNSNRNTDIKNDIFLSLTKHNRIYVGDISDNLYITPKESKVLYYLCNGYCQKKIGEIIGCSTRTTEDYINKIRTKFRIRKKSDLTAFCIKYGIIEKIYSTFPEIVLPGSDIRKMYTTINHFT